MKMQSNVYNWIIFIIAIVYATTHIDLNVMFSGFTNFLYQFINFALYFAAIFIGLKLLFKLARYMYAKLAV
ncbi:hypothetical protein [Caryophanon tenue]|uniref:Uncharacterized protein n=1 Tax=Caryophanon tenue TaxID=33978 RepID=A0A1C0YC88_9BACL|nr:hypothetical protein [Caryophanon tenue]OCS84755.1 hypothetical protein A6M13_04025 [Caryophanon tenue]